jgi:CubicO group peptidase (beta-lactamase class C family)
VLKAWLSATDLEGPPGKQTVYGDLNFMILGWAVETLAAERLDRFVERRICRPLALGDLFFIPLDEAAPAAGYAATERCPWRGTLNGQVHDDNCWTLGGVCGHAGLFGTAAAVHRLLVRLLDAYRGRDGDPLWSTERVRSFLDGPQDGRRPMGFDRPSVAAPSCGRHFSDRTVGHLGFTGTSFWMDLRSGIIVILLTNRVHPTRRNEAIRAFRPKLHDAVVQGLKADI